MTRAAVCLCLLAVIAVGNGKPAAAQDGGTPTTPSPLLLIYREEVRPGKGAAHAANEAQWAAAFRKGEAPVHWLGMTTIVGPNEAWFLSAFESWEAHQREEDTMDANVALTAEGDKFSAQDGELLTRSSTMMARYRPAISYQPDVSLPQMRYMQVDMVRVKPGRTREFTEAWRAIVEAHEKAKMDEHWAVYQVTAGHPDDTFLFFYPLRTLAEIDQAGPLHAGEAFRDAMGEGGRNRMNELTIATVDASQRLVFALRPNMSLLTKAWTDADPFWTPKAAGGPVVGAKKPAAKP